MRLVYVVAAVLLSTAAFAESLSVTTFAGSDSGPGYRDGVGNAARFYQPQALAVDASGNVLVADQAAHTIRHITPAGVVTTLAGVGGELGYTDGRSGVARFNAPSAIAVDGSGNVYVADNFGSLRKISPSRVVTRVASSFPLGITVDSRGNIFGTDGNTIQKITPGGTMTTFVSAADTLQGLTIDGSDNLYFTVRNGGIYKCTPQGVIANIAGGISNPWDLDVDAAGNLYVISGRQILKVTAGGTVTNFAGSAIWGNQDGTGNAASFGDLRGIELSPDGSLLYVADAANTTIRRITVPGAVVTTFAGREDRSEMREGTGLDARFSRPRDAAVAPDGNVYVLDNSRIRKITPAGVTSTFAGGVTGTADGLGTAARFGVLSHIAIAYADTDHWVFYVTDDQYNSVRKITREGFVTTVATGLQNPAGIAVSANGTVYVAELNGHTIKKIDVPSHIVTVLAGASGTPGYVDATGTAARFQKPTGLAIDAGGTLYVSDSSNYRIRRIDLATAAVTTYARSEAPGDIHAVGNDLYVAEPGAVRLIEPGAVGTTVAGKAFNRINRDGTGELAGFEDAPGIGGNSHTNLYLCDAAANNVRKACIPGIADVATTSSATPLPQTVVQLDTEPGTATKWTWSIERRPTGSTAQLSSTTVRNPTFTPDIADLYTFLLRAEGPNRIRYSTVDVTAMTCADPLVVASTATTGVCVSGTSGTASVSVTGGTGFAYQWGYRVWSGGPIHPIGGEQSATYTIAGSDLSGPGTRYLVVTVTPSCGGPAVSNELPLDVTAPPDARISSNSVYASTKNFASVADAGAGATYAWSMTNGTITAGQDTRSIEFTAGARDPILLSVTVSRNGCSSSGTARLYIQPLPDGATMLYVVTPCRVVDTRNSTAIANGETRNFPFAGVCGIPSDAKSVVANVTAVTPATDGWLALWAAGTQWSGTSTLSYRTGKTRANNTIIALPNDGNVSVLNSGGLQHIIVDVTGYFR